MFEILSIPYPFLRRDMLQRAMGIRSSAKLKKILVKYFHLDQPDFEEVSMREKSKTYFDLRTTWSSPVGFVKVFLVEMKRPEELRPEELSKILRKREGGEKLSRHECVKLAKLAFLEGVRGE